MTAIPRALASQVSLSAADTLLTGAEPKMPPEESCNEMEVAFSLVTVTRDDQAKQNIAGNMDHLRPHISEIATHKRGPKANHRLLVPWPVKRHQDNSVGYRDSDCNADFGSAKSNTDKLLTRILK